jgi:hypothetical protein
MKDVFKELKTIVRKAEADWKKNIRDEKNPVLKMIKQDYKDLVDIQTKLWGLNAKYGIEVRLYFPKPKRDRWFRSVSELIK